MLNCIEKLQDKKSTLCWDTRGNAIKYEYLMYVLKWFNGSTRNRNVFGTSFYMRLGHMWKNGSEKINRIFCTKSPIITERESPPSAKMPTSKGINDWKKHRAEKVSSEKKNLGWKYVGISMINIFVLLYIMSRQNAKNFQRWVGHWKIPNLILGILKKIYT